MSKGLETLKYLRECFGDRYYKNELDIIETALKRLEEMDDVYHILVIQRAELIEEKRKQDEILRIIKEKGSFLHLKYDKYRNKYYIYDNELYMYNEITKEEYDLLKEALL